MEQLFRRANTNATFVELGDACAFTILATSQLDGTYVAPTQDPNFVSGNMGSNFRRFLNYCTRTDKGTLTQDWWAFSRLQSLDLI